MALLRWAGFGLLALAIFLSVAAYRAVSKRGVALEAEPTPPAPVLVATRDLPEGHVVEDRDVVVSLEQVEGEDALREARAVIGRTLASQLREGEVICARHLSPLGVLARGLRDGETAVAVEVDGVTGLGGFVQPGDAVDVLFVLKRDGREIKHTQARTLLVNVRVLAFGTKLEEGGSDEPTLNARTAVLAVPASDAPTLLLADVVGTLRLALRQSGITPSRAPYPRASLDELLRRERIAPKPRSSIRIIRGDRPRSAP